MVMMVMMRMMRMMRGRGEEGERGVQDMRCSDHRHSHTVHHEEVGGCDGLIGTFNI